MADRPTTLRPTADVLPADRLRNLIDRACRHLTPAEANALRGALAGTMRNATTAVEGLHQRAAAALDDHERQFLTFALDLAADRVLSEDGFTDEDDAALASLRRMAAAARPDNTGGEREA